MRLLWHFWAVLTAAASLYDTVNASSQSREALQYLSLLQDPVITTPSHRVHAHSHFDIEFHLHNKQQRIRLSLEPNHGILGEGASVQYLDSEGRLLRTEPIDRSEHKVFKGQTWLEERDGSWINVGWARIMVRRDGKHPLFEGAFSLTHDSHHIQLRSNYLQTKHEDDPGLDTGDDEYMVVFRDSDIGRQRHRDLRKREDALQVCSAHTLRFNTDPQHPIYTAMLKRDFGSWGSISVNSLLGKRQIDGSGIATGGNSGGVNLKSTIGSSNGCPSTRKVALIGVATDCTYTGLFDSTEAARLNVITQINSASQIYEQSFNITLGLQNLTVSEKICPGTPPAATPWNIGCAAANITQRLNTFSAWRGQHNDSNAYWTLLTACNTNSEVGLAWLGQLCVNDVISGSGETVSGANVVARTSTEWQVIAHESGHTFGAVHDCDSTTCADGITVNAQQCCPLATSSCDAGGQFIMNPSTGSGISSFSACTVGNICTAMLTNSVKKSCLSDNAGVTVISGQECGNGIVEHGEECDCGGVASCGSDACCDPKTCKFVTHAVCDDSNDDCCHNCQFSVSGTVCRKSTSICDPQETCSGMNSTCPPDVTSPNGQGCGSGLSCASGQCTSRDLQCRTLMGSYTTHNDTYACNSQDCTLSCASPDFGANQCYSMQQNFLDGTDCGGGGRCSNGQCSGSSTFGQVVDWIDNNKPLVIGLSCGIGGLLLISILGCIVRRCRRPRPISRNKAASLAGPPMQAWAPGLQIGGWPGNNAHRGSEYGYSVHQPTSVRYA